MSCELEKAQQTHNQQQSEIRVDDEAKPEGEDGSEIDEPVRAKSKPQPAKEATVMPQRRVFRRAPESRDVFRGENARRGPLDRLKKGAVGFGELGIYPF